MLMGQCNNDLRDDVTSIPDIFAQLDRCVDEAGNAKCNGDWNAAYAEKQKLDKRIDAFDAVEAVRAGTQFLVAISSITNGNWLGFVASLATVTAIIMSFRNRHKIKASAQ